MPALHSARDCSLHSIGDVSEWVGNPRSQQFKFNLRVDGSNAVKTQFRLVCRRPTICLKCFQCHSEQSDYFKSRKVDFGCFLFLILN